MKLIGWGYHRTRILLFQEEIDVWCMIPALQTHITQVKYMNYTMVTVYCAYVNIRRTNFTFCPLRIKYCREGRWESYLAYHSTRQQSHLNGYTSYLLFQRIFIFAKRKRASIGMPILTGVREPLFFLSSTIYDDEMKFYVQLVCMVYLFTL